ncbi:VOC family protein [Halorarum halobium]|uniref:VOC family protein n=1 Tax=Halorarum halobium TaxID=3075121 RepID=UPI0028AF1AB3|nr:VOC family protein [Halobaculum sp. XH14]
MTTAGPPPDGEPPTLPDDARVGRTALFVNDLDAQIDFYRDVVGLTVLDADETGATLGAGGTPLLELLVDEEAPPRDRDQAGLFHVAFRFPSRAALGAALERVTDRWSLEGASDHLVSEALYLTDPEGNGVELHRDRPSAEWPRREDGTVEIDTLPLDLDALAAAAGGDTAPADATGTTSGEATDTAPTDTTIGHVHLEVTSIEAARRFYVDTLGLGVQTDLGSALFVAAGGYHHHLGLNTWNRRTRAAGGRGLAWVELLVPDEESLAAACRRLEADDVAVTERGDVIETSDPDGIAVRLGVE